jgi:hypothetical protein
MRRFDWRDLIGKPGQQGGEVFRRLQSLIEAVAFRRRWFTWHRYLGRDPSSHGEHGMMEWVKEARMKKAVVRSTGHVREGRLSHVANDLKVGIMTVCIGGKEFVAENPGLRACECSAGQLHALFDLIPDITLDDLARFLIDYSA